MYSAVLPTLALLSLFGAIVQVSADAEQDFNLALTCRQQNKSLFKGPGGECRCDSTTASPGTGWSKCAAPTGDAEYGISICLSSSTTGTSEAKCIIECSGEAELTADKKGCNLYPSAGGVTLQTFLDNQAPTKYVGAYASGSGCAYARESDILRDGGKVCKNEPRPANSVPACVWNRERLGPAHCSFECAPTFRLDQTTNTCVAESSGGSGGSEGGDHAGDSESKECVPPSYTAFASASDQCRCYRRPASAQAAATKCNPPPSGHGTAGCKTISPTSSECMVKCDADYIPTADKLDCKPSAPAATVPEDECSSEETGTYLIADPVLGCRCSKTQEAGWCGLPTPETATMTCKHDAGLVNARCTVADCPSGSAPSATNPLECASSDGATGRMNGNTDCAGGKVYALPGRAGCACVLAGQTAPSGATECRSPPEDGWAVCSFPRVTTPARCLIACAPPSAITPENTCE